MVEDDIKIVTLDLEHVDSMREVARVAVTSFGKVICVCLRWRAPRARDCVGAQRSSPTDHWNLR